MTLTSRLSLIIALVVGGIAAFLVRGVIQNMAAMSERAGRTSTIVVARKAILFGAPLTPDNLQEMPWRSADPLEGSFATVSDVLKDGRRLALQSMQRNEPILVSRVTGPNQRSTLSTEIDEGMRAVTIRVDEVRGVAGFILPGDRVDVISTRGEGGGQDSAAYADVLLQDAKVLAVDQLSNERQDKPTIARAVTLELTVEQAQKVVLAQGVGRLSLALRQANASGKDSTTRVTVRDLGGAEPVARDRLAEIDKRLDQMKASADTALTLADRNTAQKLTEFESRIRAEMLSQAAAHATAAPTPSRRPDPSSSIVTVIRNGSKSENYPVSAER